MAGPLGGQALAFSRVNESSGTVSRAHSLPKFFLDYDHSVGTRQANHAGLLTGAKFCLGSGAKHTKQYALSVA